MGAEYWDQSVCPLAYLRNHTPKLHQTFCACYPWPWLCPPGGVAICYVLPVLGPMAYASYVSTVNLKVTQQRQHRIGIGEKSDVYDRFWIG